MSRRLRSIVQQFGKLDEYTPPEFIENNLQQCTNVDFRKYPRLMKRPGVDMASSTSTTMPLALMPYQGRLAQVGDITAEQYLYHESSGTSESTANRIGFARIRRTEVFFDSHYFTKEFVDSCYLEASGHWVTAFVLETASSLASGLLYVLVTDANGAVVERGQFNITVVGTVQAVANADGDKALVLADESTDLYGLVVSVSSGAVTIGNGSVIESAYKDALCACGLNATAATSASADWCYSFLDTANNFHLKTITSALSKTTLVSSAGLYLGTACHSPVGVATDYIWYAVFDAAAVAIKVGIERANGTAIASLTTVANPTDPKNLGICASAALNAVVSYTEDESSSGEGDFVHKWYHLTGPTISAGTAGNGFRLLANSKPFVLASRTVQWCSIERALSGTTAEGLLILAELTTQTTTQAARVAATAAFGETRSMTHEIGKSLRTVTLDSTVREAYVAINANRRGADNHMGVEICGAYLDHRRFQSAEFNGLLYYAGGVLNVSDGYDVWENSFAMPPRIKVADAGSGSTVATGTYDYVAVYERQDKFGNLHQSVPGNVATLTLNPSRDVTITLWPISANNHMHKQPGNGHQDTTQIFLAVYKRRTDSNGDSIFYRQFPLSNANPGPIPSSSYENDPLATGTVTVTEDDSSFFSNKHPILYGGVDANSDQGYLAKDHISGGCSCLTVHKNRLFIGGGEIGTRIYYSEEAQFGEPANFNYAYVIELPSEPDIRMLASLDDILIVGGPSGLWKVFGEGPNRLGDPQSGNFSSPVPLPSETGAHEPYTAATPNGLFFVGRNNQIYLLDRGRVARRADKPIETTRGTYAYVRGVVYKQHTNQVYFLLHDNEVADSVTAHRIAVLDLDNECWSIYQHASGVSVVHAMCYHGGQIHFANADGQIFAEGSGFSDDGSWYGMTVVTGQQGFGNAMGKKSLARVKLLTQRVAATGGLDLKIKTHGNARAAVETTHVLTDAMLQAREPVVSAKHQMGARYEITIEERSGAAAQGYDLLAMGVEVADYGQLDKEDSARSA